MHKATVVLPMYEWSPYVKRAVLSVKRQSFREDLEFIVLDFRKEKATTEIAELTACFGENGLKILTGEKKKFYATLNEAIQMAEGEYLLFLAQNCVLTKNVLEILYSRAQKNEADILIGNIAKQRGKNIDVEAVLGKKIGRDETLNLAGQNDVLAEDFSLYNKFMKVSTLQASAATFAKVNPNSMFLTQVESCAKNIFWINREVCLCGGKKIYEYNGRTAKDYARAVVRRIKKLIK
jgi:glycosyltransferase involved in cell wall biosynthesis